MTASFAGDDPANLLEPPSDEDEAQEEEQPGIDYDIRATVTLANGINAATFEDESHCGVAHWLVKNGNGKTLATIKVTDIQRSES